MAKQLTHDLTYDAPLADVAAMLADPAFRAEVCDRQRVLRHEVQITGAGAGMRVSVDQVQSASGIPSYAKKIVGDEINIVQTESWSSESAGIVDVDIPGKPGDISGTIAMVESGGVTTETVSFNIKVGIPLVGGKVEGLVLDLLRKALQAENAVGRDYLSR